MIEIYELEVYKLAEELSDLIWNVFDEWSVKAQETIGYQIIRGLRALHPGRPAQILPVFSRSFEETEAWLRKAIRRKLIPNPEVQKYTDIINELGPKLNAFINQTR